MTCYFAGSRFIQSSVTIASYTDQAACQGNYQNILVFKVRQKTRWGAKSDEISKPANPSKKGQRKNHKLNKKQAGGPKEHQPGEGERVVHTVLQRPN
jgi:hypothetical protein